MRTNASVEFSASTFRQLAPPFKILSACLAGAVFSALLVGPRAAQAQDRYAVLVGGAGGEEKYTKRHWEWISRMYRALRQNMGFDERKIYVLFEDEKLDSTINGRATKLELEKALNEIAAKARPEDLVFILIVGHGSFDGEVSKINLVGPDMTDHELARLLSKIRARHRIVVNATSASGGFVKTLSSKGLIVIAATRSGAEKQDTIFPEFFIEAFESGESDADKDGQTSILEAFNYARQKVKQWYEKDGKLQTEHALLDDDGDRVGHAEPGAGNGDGLLSAAVYLKPAASSYAEDYPELKRLLAEKEQIERKINELKSKRSQIADEKYESEMEALLVKLARLNREIKTRVQR